jgi:hypothetical protein
VTPLAPPYSGVPEGPGGLGWLVLGIQALPIVVASVWWIALQWREATSRKDGRES